MPKGGGCSIFVPREEGSSCPIASARRPPRSRLDAALKASRRNKVERERGRRQVERGCRGAKRRKAPARAPSRETRSLPVPAAPGQPVSTRSRACPMGRGESEPGARSRRRRDLNGARGFAAAARRGRERCAGRRFRKTRLRFPRRLSFACKWRRKRLKGLKTSLELAPPLARRRDASPLPQAKAFPFAAPSTSRPEMVPQAIEKAQNPPGNWCPLCRAGGRGAPAPAGRLPLGLR